MDTVMTENHDALVQPFMVTVNHGDEGAASAGGRCHSVDSPMPTATSKIGLGIVDPQLVKYYGTKAVTQSVDEPLDTVTAKDRFGLVEFEGQLHRLDVRFRMLQPHELSQAQGFPKDYKFEGNRESVVKQIGNAVPVNLAKALCRELIGPTR
jgi:DNA (cytosine-5)-methyltransferase 1